MNDQAAYWIDTLELIPYPIGTGGYFRETYRSPDMLAHDGLPERYEGARSACTLIYFMLCDKQIDPFHRLKSDETWHFYAGTALILHIIDAAGNYTAITLGPAANVGQQFHTVVRAGCWFAAAVANPGDPGAYALVGCMVAPGFEMQDAEWDARDGLLRTYPQHAEIITQLT
jgi:predicted cupin superfamily sugar epimerase